MKGSYFVYILSNRTRNVIYIGVTNDLSRRLLEHMNENIAGFTQKYNCKDLVYYEQHTFINNAISREKEIKEWRREKKEILINTFNPEWKSLNERFVRIN